MKPQKLRSLLEPYGTINRIFLSPEDPTAHSRRVKNGGNKKRSFTDGWVEFVKKKDAKAAVDLLRGQVIGGKKGSFYRDDLWSLSYLKGFKWRKSSPYLSPNDHDSH
jgi:ESF2/ABP1 family protein